MKRRKRERERVGSVEFSWRWKEAGNGVGGEQLAAEKTAAVQHKRTERLIDLLV